MAKLLPGYYNKIPTKLEYAKFVLHQLTKASKIQIRFTKILEIMAEFLNYTDSQTAELLAKLENERNQRKRTLSDETKLELAWYANNWKKEK